MAGSGRDARFIARPPAQNRTGGFPAYGSHLGCVTAKRWLGQGWRIVGFGSQASTSCVIRSHVIRSFWLRRRAATRKCHSGHETAARIDATKHAIHQPDAHQVALDRARKGVTRAKHFPEITCFAQCALQRCPVHQEWPQGTSQLGSNSEELSVSKCLQGRP
jgi:hypothetical protein